MQNMNNLFKDLLTLCLVFCLLNLQLGNFGRDGAFSLGFSTSFAQEEPVNLDCDTKDKALQNTGSCQVDTTKTEGQALIATDQYLGMILMVAVAIVTVLLLVNCLSKFNDCGLSTKVAAVGGLAFIVADIASIMQYEDMEDEITYSRDGLRKNKDACEAGGVDLGGSGVGSIKNKDGETKTACEQWDALKAQKKSYEAAKSASKTKAIIMGVGAAAFLIAAIMATVNAVTLNGVLNTLNAALIKLETAATGGCATACATDAAAMPKCTAMTLSPAIAACVAEELIRCKLVCVPCAAACPEAMFTQSDLITMAIKTTPDRADIQTPIALAKNEAIDKLLTGPCGSLGDDFSTRSTLLHTAHMAVNAAWWAQKKLLKTALAAISSESPATGRSVPGPMKFYVRQIKKNSAGQMVQAQANASKSEEDFIAWINSDDDSLPEPLLVAKSGRLMEKFVDLLVPKAHGANIIHKWTKGVGLGVVGAAIILSLIIIYFKSSALILMTPTVRAILFGSFVVLSGVTIGINIGIMNAMDENIEAIDAIINLAQSQARAAQVSVDQQNIPYSDYALAFEQDYGEELKLQKGGGPVHCNFGGDGKGGCRKRGQQIASQLAVAGLGKGAGSTSNLVGKASDSLGKDSLTGKDLKNFAALGGKKNALRKHLKKLQKRLNKSRNKLGKKGINIGKLSKRFIRKMKRRAQRALRSKGVSSKDLAVALGSASGGVKKDGKNKRASALRKVAKFAPGAPKASDPFSGLNFQLQEDEDEDAGIELDEDAVGGTGVDGDSYDIPKEDIFSNPDASIFKMITTRYMKTAYPIFFEEQNSPESTGAVQP